MPLGLGMTSREQAIAGAVMPRDGRIPNVAELDCYSPLEWSLGRIGLLDRAKAEYIGRLIAEALSCG